MSHNPQVVLNCMYLTTTGAQTAPDWSWWNIWKCAKSLCRAAVWGLYEYIQPVHAPSSEALLWYSPQQPSCRTYSITAKCFERLLMSHFKSFLYLPQWTHIVFLTAIIVNRICHLCCTTLYKQTQMVLLFWGGNHAEFYTTTLLLSLTSLVLFST